MSLSVVYTRMFAVLDETIAPVKRGTDNVFVLVLDICTLMLWLALAKLRPVRSRCSESTAASVRGRVCRLCLHNVGDKCGIMF